MDETGFSIGTIQSSRVIINKEMRRQFQAQLGCQEWVSVVECISADKTVLPPLVIYKGEALYTCWIPTEAPQTWRFSCNTRRWTSNIHGLDDEHASSQRSHGAKGAKEAKDLALGKAKMPRD